MREEVNIIREFTKGNKSAFKYIYENYCDVVYSNIRKIVKPVENAEDILQEVFAALWINRSKIQPEISIGNWLFVVSYNKSVSFLKKKLKENVVYLSDIPSQDIDDFPQVDEEIYGEQVKLLDNAIDRLPQHKRKVFCLYHFENKSYDEIAEELNLSVSSVKFYLKQSKSFIRNYVGSSANHIAGISLLIFMIQLH